MVQIVNFRPAERIIVDPSCYESIRRKLGHVQAEEHYMTSVEEISERLAEIDWDLRSALSPEIAYQARRVASLSREIGLTSLANVALDLAATIERGDETASRAIWTRLVRVGDVSLAEIWDVPGLSM